MQARTVTLGFAAVVGTAVLLNVAIPDKAEAACLPPWVVVTPDGVQQGASGFTLDYVTRTITIKAPDPIFCNGYEQEVLTIAKSSRTMSPPLKKGNPVAPTATTKRVN